MNLFVRYFEHYERAFSTWPLDEYYAITNLLTFFVLVYSFIIFIFPKMTYRKMARTLRYGWFPYLAFVFSMFPSLISVPVFVFLILLDSLEYRKNIIPMITEYAKKGVICPHKSYNKQVKSWELVAHDEKEKLIRENTDGVEGDFTLIQRILLISIPFTIAKLYYLTYGFIF